MSAIDDNAVRFERAVLGSLIAEPSLWPQADLTTNQFQITAHRDIWQSLCRLNGDGIPADLIVVTSDLDGKVEPSYLAELLDGVVPINFKSYVREVQKAAHERCFKRLHERLGNTDRDERLALVEELSNLLHDSNPQDWHALFHTYPEVAQAPQPEWLIQNFAEVEDILMIGGPSGHGKSLLLLSICRALLTGKPLFNHAQFQVPRPSERVLYLIPEVGLRAFRRRLEWFHLLPFVQSENLYIRTLSRGPVIKLTDPRLLAAAEGSDVILDTAIRFSEGDESSAADNRDGLAATLFGLSRAGAHSVLCAHHSPKDFAKQTELTLENCLRGSGDIGAMLTTAYGIRQVDPANNRILVTCVKPRDLEPLGPFEVQGRPFISDVGDFRVVSEPSNRPVSEMLNDATSRKSRVLADELFAQGKSANFVAEELRKQGLGKKRVEISRWQREFKEQQQEGSQSVSQTLFPPKAGKRETPGNGTAGTPLEGGVRPTHSTVGFETEGNTLRHLI
jgi:hypothetical protein